MTAAFSLSTFLLVAFALTLGVTLILVPLVRSLAIRNGWVDKPDDRRKMHSSATPTMGGVAIAGGAGIGVLFLHRTAEFSSIDITLPSAVFMGGALVMVFAGVYDDIKGLGYKRKILVQLFVAYALIYAGYRIDLSGLPFLSGDPYQHALISITITMAWILGVINAVNLIDGLDGLAAGVVLVAFLCLATVFGLQGEIGLVMIAVVMAGALGGFLIYNFNPASIFMGDSGSLFLGFAVAAYSLEAQAHTNQVLSILIPAIALGVPVLDTLLSLIRRVQERKAFWLPDHDHIHHRLARSLSIRATVVTLYVVAALFAVAAIFMAVASPGFGFTIFAFTLLASYGGLRLLKYQPLRRPASAGADQRREVEAGGDGWPAEESPEFEPVPARNGNRMPDTSSKPGNKEKRPVGGDPATEFIRL